MQQGIRKLTARVDGSLSTMQQDIGKLTVRVDGVLGIILTRSVLNTIKREYEIIKETRVIK